MKSDKKKKNGKSDVQSNINNLIAQAEARELIKSTTFNIVTNIGDPNKAITLHGDMVSRQDSIFVDAEYGIVTCCPYDNHFIYENPDVVIRRNKGVRFLCTCGSPAIIVWGEEVPIEVAGKLVCQYDAVTGFKGKHVTDVLNKSDFNDRETSTQKLK